MKINLKGLHRSLGSRIAQKPFMFSLIVFMIGASIFAYGLTRASCANSVVCSGTYASDSTSAKSVLEGKNTGDVKAIWNVYQVNSNFTGLVKGSVNKRNEVIVNGKVVAINANTVGRQKIASSDKAIIAGGTTFWQRQPSVSFRNDSLSAWVRMENGVFKYAILQSCGNPVQAAPTGTPAPEPAPADTTEYPRIYVKKYVSPKDGTQVKTGNILTYTIDVSRKDNGKINTPEFQVGDVIQEGLDLVDGSAKAYAVGSDGKEVQLTSGMRIDKVAKISGDNVRFTFTDGVYKEIWGMGKVSFRLKFQAKVTADAKQEEVCNFAAYNYTAGIEATGGLVFVTNEVCNPLPEPVVSTPVTCKYMTITDYNTGKEITAGSTVKAGTRIKVRGETTDNSRVSGYTINWGDGEENSTNNHTYTEAGTYTIVETFNYKDSSGKIIGSNKCQSSIKVEASVTPIPVYKCTNLTFEKLTRTSFKFTVNGEARNGATITGYVIKVDGREVYNGTANNFTYNQTTPGTYTVKAYVKTNKGTTAEVAVCTKTITVKPAPEIPTYTIKKYVNTQDAQDENGAVTVGPNVPFEYKIVVKNTSDTATINSIKAWDVLPAGVEYVDNTLKLNGVAVANDSDYFNSAKGVEITNLAAGREAIFTFQAIIKAETDEKKAEMCANVSGGTFYNNVAKADPKAQGTGEAASDLPEKQDPAVIKCTFIARPNYTIKKYVNTRDAQDENSAVTVGPNVPFEYKIEVTNTGNVDLKNVKVWDVLPSEGITVQYIDGTLKQDGNLLTQDDNFFNSSVGVTVNTLAKNQTITFTFMAKVVMNMESPGSIEGTPCTPSGTFYKNVAKADPESAAGASANDPNLGPKEDPAVIKCTFTPPVKNPSVIIDKEVSDYQVTVGGQFTWFVTVTNNGDVDLKNVVVSDQAPANTEFLKAAELAGTTIQIDSKSFKATISELKVGQKVTFAITAKLVNYQSSDITNTACVNAPEVNPTKPSEDDDCDDAKIKPVKEKCTVPGMENKGKDDPTCKPKCSVKGKENLYADDKNCKDPDCIEVGGKIISTKGKGGCENPTAITAPSVTPNTGMQIIAASASTLGLSAAAFMATSRFQKRKK